VKGYLPVGTQRARARGVGRLTIAAVDGMLVVHRMGRGRAAWYATCDTDMGDRDDGHAVACEKPLMCSVGRLTAALFDNADRRPRHRGRRDARIGREHGATVRDRNVDQPQRFPNMEPT